MRHTIARIVATTALTLTAPVGVWAGGAAQADPLPPAGVASGGDPGGGASALIVYDYDTTYTANANLGEQVAMAVANLTSHFGRWTAEPTNLYSAGQVEDYTATIYVGGTYDEPLPDAFISDVTSTTHPVIWLGANIWRLVPDAASATAFQAKYGWNAQIGEAGAHYVDGVTGVVYKGRTLTRSALAGQVVDPGPYASPAQVVATAIDATTGDFPWALRAANLTFIGELPFAYVNETDRVIAFEDILFDALAPGTPTRHRALLRLEDISCDSDPADLNRDEKYLANHHVPYGIAVIPHFKDPTGYENGDGVAVDETLSDCPDVLKAIKNMLKHGAVLVDHGDTHQYSDVPNPNTTSGIPIANPYDGVSADDFEFFMSHLDGNDNVIYDGPVPTDSQSWAQGRLDDASRIFAHVGLRPSIWEFPHYAASYVDYQAVAKSFAVRWDRGLYYNGSLAGNGIQNNSYLGQFFPYVVTDIYGTKVLPEDMGNYEPEAENNHPARLVPDLLAASRANLAVRDGFAATFFHPYYPLSALKALINGMKSQGYRFVDPSSL